LNAAESNLSSSSPIPRRDGHGAAIPAIGLGTSGLRGPDCVRAVGSALAAGYRHIDTAVMYGNETEVGQAIAASGLPRDEIFVTTKVLPADLGAGDLQKSARASLGRLQLDQVDLLLIHWPNRAIPLTQSVAALCDAKRQGMARYIGVANFPVALLDDAVRLAATHGEALAANQCEYHPRLDQTKLLAACRRHGVVFVAYSPIGKGGYESDPVVSAIARRLGKTAAQIVLRWHMQQPGVAAIPKSRSPGHQAENLAVFDFELTDADMAAMSALKRPDGRLVRPAMAPDWD
jgi:diketogulonate reductase-like aldo/keto reductase